MTNEDTTDFDEHFAKISSYIVDTLHGVPLEMNEDEKEQFRIQVISNQYAERLLSEAEKTETYRGLSKIDILHEASLAGKPILLAGAENSANGISWLILVIGSK